VFAKNCFPQLSPIHELSKLQWYPLNLAALSADDAEEGVYFGRRRGRRSIIWRSTRTRCSSRNSGLVLTSHRVPRVALHRSGRRGYCSRVLGFVLTAVRAAATSFFHWSTDVQVRSTCIGHGDRCWEKKP
jgi:hypothetical protein